MTNLSTQATRVILDEVYVVAGPGHASYDDTFEQRMRETKKRRLQVAEALKADATAEEEKKGLFGKSSMGRLVETIIQNLTVRINRIHVRYEDVDTDGKPFCAGFTLESLLAEAANADWKTVVGDAVEGAFRKLVSLQNVSLYWDIGGQMLSFNSAEEMAKQMSNLIFSNAAKEKGSAPSHNYILPPVSGSAKFTLNHNFETSLLPQVDCEFGFDKLFVGLSQVQWRQLTRILDGVSGEIRGLQYRKFRPKQPPEKAPAEWWHYAISSIVTDVRQKAQQMTWKWIEDFAKDRKDYVGLWYIKLRSGRKKGCWSQQQRVLKRAIVERRTFDQIMSFRSIAESFYMRQRELLKEAFSKTSNPFKRSKLETEIMDVNISTMPQEKWMELRLSLQAAETGEDKYHAGKMVMSADYVRQNFVFFLKGMEVELRDEAENSQVVSLALNTVKAHIRGCEDGTTHVNAVLNSLQILDWFTRPGHALVVVEPSRFKAVKDQELVNVNVTVLPRGQKEVRVKARTIDVIFPIPLIMRIRDFFAAGGAGLALAQLRDDATHRAEGAIQARPTYPTKLLVELDSPNVAFCESFQQWPRCTRLVGALGKLTLTSEKDDFFSATITSICAGMAYPDLEDWQEAVAQPFGGVAGRWVNVLQETSLTMDIQVQKKTPRDVVVLKGGFTSVPRISATHNVIIDIVRVSIGMALGALAAEQRSLALESAAAGVTVLPQAGPGVDISLLMPSIEIDVEMLASTESLTRLLLKDTLLRVVRDSGGRVDVELGIGSLTAFDCILKRVLGDGQDRPMVWSESTSQAGEQHVVLKVVSWPHDLVEVDLQIRTMRLAMQRETALQVAVFSESLGLTIDSLVPDELRGKKTTTGPKEKQHVKLSIQTGDILIELLRAGKPFIGIGLSRSNVNLDLLPFQTSINLLVGAITVRDLLAKGPYSSVLTTSGEHTASVQMDLYDPLHPSHPGMDFSVVARVSSLRFVLLMDLVQDTSIYFAELGQMMDLLRGKAKKAAAEAVRSAVRPALALDLEAVTFVVPSSSSDTRCFVAKVHQVGVAAKPEGSIAVAVTRVVVVSALFDASSIETPYMDPKTLLHEWSGAVSVARQLEDSQASLSIVCHSEAPLHVAFLEEQLDLLFDLLEFNVGSVSEKRDEDLDVTAGELHRQILTASSAAAEDVVVVPFEPLKISVSAQFKELAVSFGSSLGLFICQGLSLDAKIAKTIFVDLSLDNLRMKDARPSVNPPVIDLVESVDSEKLFRMTFRKAEGEFDDIGLTIGSIKAILDPAWLYELTHITLPIIDRAITVAEKLQDASKAIAAVKVDADLPKLHGAHLLLQMRRPQVCLVDGKTNQALAHAVVVLGASNVSLERTEGPEHEFRMDVAVSGIEVWKSRFGTSERASILFPFAVNVVNEEVLGELSSVALSLSEMTVDFTYQDLILVHSLVQRWMQVWDPETAAQAEKALHEEEIGSPLTPRKLDVSPFRLELASNRAFAVDVRGLPPQVSLRKRHAEGKAMQSVQSIKFVEGRCVFNFGREAQWCLTVESQPKSGSIICAAQVHPAKSPAQLWDWLPSSGASGIGRFVLRADPSLCLAVGGKNAVEAAPLELQRVVEDSSQQLWHVPFWIVQFIPVASPSPMLGHDAVKEKRRLIMPDRWTVKALPKAQQLSIRLVGGLHIRVIDDLSGNIRPIARALLAETQVQIANWSNKGDLHCVFTLKLEADYFNEDLEAWEPLLRGIENISVPEGRERAWDLQLSMSRSPESFLRITAISTAALSITGSRALVPTMIRLYEAWDDRKTFEGPVSRPAPCPPRLSNRTGQTLRWRNLYTTVSGVEESGKLAAGESVDLNMSKTLAGQQGAKVGLRVGEGGWITCPVDAVAQHTFRLEDGLTAVVEIEKRANGLREVAVRSNVILSNLTDHPIVVQLISAQEVVVRPGSTFAVPFEGLHLPLKLCPDTQMYQLSDRSIVTGTLLQRTPEVPPIPPATHSTSREASEIIRCRHTLGGASWTWAVHVQGRLSDESSRAWQWEIACRPPLVLRNLLHARALFRIAVPGHKGTEDDYETLFDGELEKGGSLQLHRIGEVDALFLIVKIAGYRWSTPMRIGGPNASRGTRLNTIRLDHTVEGGSRTVTMYASYWLVNDVGLPCVWSDADTGKPIPGQPSLKKDGTLSTASATSIDSSPMLWFDAKNDTIREPVLFWEGPSLFFQVQSASRSGRLVLGGTVGAIGALQVQGPQTSLLEFGVQVFNAPGEFWRTKVLQLSNRFFLVNVTGRPLVYGQVGAAQEFVLPHGYQVPYHWADMNKNKLLHIKLDDGDWSWSGGFTLHDGSLFELMVREKRTLQSSRIIVQSISDGPTTAVLFHSGADRMPMYSIRNSTGIPLVVKQAGVSDRGEEVPPHSTVPFAWADPSIEERVVQVMCVQGSGVDVVGGQFPRYCLDEVTDLGSFSVQKKGLRKPMVCHVSLFLSGATKVLSIEEEGERQLLVDDFKDLAPPVTNCIVVFTIPGISVSLVSGRPEEICHAWLDTISLEIQAGTEQQTLELNIAAFQVDNQLRNKVYETAIWGRSVDEKPFFHLAINRGNRNSGLGLQFFNGIEVVVQEINVSVDEALVTYLLQATYDLIEYLDKSLNQNVVRRTPDFTKQALSTNDMVYARLVFLGPIRVILSYSSCPWGAASLKGDVVEKVLRVLGPVSGLERAALQLNSLRLDNAFASKNNMVQLISEHYKRAASKKLLLLLGSAHFIGSPITLVESIGTGFWDLWYEPVLGLTHSPQAFAVGVQKGTKSMLSKTVYGVAKSASDLTGSIGNVTAQLSFDPQYIEERERERKQQAQHVGQGLTYGMWDFGKGLFDGITGLVTRPVVGAQQEGAVGFFKGVGRGLSGVVVKPIAGTFGMVSRITEGVKNTANKATFVQRIRMPRFIGSSGVIPPYDGAKAEGQEILCRLQEGAFQHEYYVFHHPPLNAASYDNQSAQRTGRILATNRHVFFLKGTSHSSMQVVWRCQLLNVLNIRQTSGKEGALFIETKGVTPIVLKAQKFFRYEMIYISFVLGRLCAEAQGKRMEHWTEDEEEELDVIPESEKVLMEIKDEEFDEK